VRKLKFVLPAAILVGIFSVTFSSCKKTTTNNIVSKDSIYYSPWVQISMTLQVQSNGDSLYFDNITAPAITAKVISQGAILGYYGYPTQSGDTAMFDEAEYGSIAGVTYAPGSIQIEGYDVDLSYNNNGFLFKYVVIPGSILAGTSLNGMTQQQLSKMSFTDIQKAINSGKQATGNTFNQ